jgi:hypothetical protein
MKSVHDQIILDPQDRYLLDNYSWCLSGPKNNQYLISAKNNKRTRFHHLILPKKEGFEVDHINRNRLDNRRCNLRYVTPSQNQMNKGMYRCNKSGFKGVSFDKINNKWLAQIRINKKAVHIGRFHTPEEASSAFISLARELYGEYIGDVV